MVTEMDVSCASAIHTLNNIWRNFFRMPGSSLWLLPPANHRLEPILSSLIKRTASHFKSPHLFLPHVTLTSEISSSTYGSDPQKWLDTISFPAGKEVLVKLGRLESQDVFVKKLYSKVSKDGVLDIGRVSRKCVEGFAEDGKAKEWTENEYYPHLSLL